MKKSAYIYYSTGDNFTKTDGFIEDDGREVVVSFSGENFAYKIRCGEFITLESVGDIKYSVCFSKKEILTDISTVFGSTRITVINESAQFEKGDDSVYIKLSYRFAESEDAQYNLIVRGKIK